MGRIESGYFTSFDGRKLFWRAALKEGDHRLLVVHGIGEHVDRYNEFVASLDELPVSIFLFDLRGHGKSEGPRVHVEHFEDFIEDLYHFRLWIAERYGPFQKLPVLFGHSLGGLIAARAALRDESSWQRLVLSSPFFRLYTNHGISELFARAMNYLAPRWSRRNPVPVEVLSHDPKEVEAYRADPLIFKQITIGMSVEIFKACHHIIEDAARLTLPLLMMGAGDDKIVSLEAENQFFSSVQSRIKILKIFDGFYHELFHEIGREKAFSFLREYFRAAFAEENA